MPVYVSMHVFTRQSISLGGPGQAVPCCSRSSPLTAVTKQTAESGSVLLLFTCRRGKGRAVLTEELISTRQRQVPVIRATYAQTEVSWIDFSDSVDPPHAHTQNQILLLIYVHIYKYWARRLEILSFAPFSACDPEN